MLIASVPLTLCSPPIIGRSMMRNELKLEIKKLAKRAFCIIQKREQNLETFREKFERRTDQPASASRVRTVNFAHRQFDPRHCKRNANVLATAIWNKVLTYEYDPEPALTFEIPKSDGSKRQVTAFGIPDAALANVLLRKTQSRNKKRFSPHSYAYHPDRNVFDAILALKEFDLEGKLFAVQIDFEKFFDNIPSRYIKDKLSDQRTLSITPHERHIFERFLHHRYGDIDKHRTNRFKRKFKGTPQGSSSSLILANLANHDLDIRLAAESGKFVRFADDVVALCRTYAEAQSVEACFERHCLDSGLIINREKSPGISIISERNHEIRTTKDFTYLGYSFKDEGLALPDKAARKFRQKISRLINIYLLFYLRFGFNSDRANRSRRYDWDLLGLIYEVRRGLYGGLTEREIQDFIYSGNRLRKMHGLMGFYCLIDDPKSLKSLDGWMVNAIRRACVVRRRILRNSYRRNCPTPSNKELILGTWLAPSAWRDSGDEDDGVEVTLPSLVRGWRAARKHFFTFGLEDVQAPGYDSSFDISSLFDVYD